ncbi:hypothetical protein LZC95_13415 [Pendulispora brunnea]|uniref:Uncharacterized protein n=1 Tax=Pendulispora brunnea TaxID=2905690 RepID=A0ABZ2KGN0_9BACT
MSFRCFALLSGALLVACHANQESPHGAGQETAHEVRDAEATCPPIALSASLEDVIRAVVSNMASKAGADSGAYVVPSPSVRDAFAAALVSTLSGDTHKACSLPASYRSFSLHDGPEDILLVAELDSSGHPAPQSFWGTYASRRSAPGTRALIVEAPHPLFDTNTPYESRAVFSEARAEWFLMAGAHRCANEGSAGCDGTTTACGGGSAPYRESDTAHATTSPFFAIHAELSKSTDAPFLQLHGNAQSCPDALISDASGSYSDAGVTARLAAAIEARGPSVGRCGLDFPKSGCSLCGTDNVEARMTAGSSQACTEKGTQYGRLVHLEQRPSLRQIPDGGTRGYQPVVDAVISTFPPR